MIETIVDNESRPVRLLIIDSDLLAGRLLQSSLMYAGFEVSVAHKEREIVQKARSFRADLALVDVQLAGEELVQLCAQLRYEHDMAVLLSSADGDVDMEPEELADHLDGHLAKPFVIQDLAALAHQVLSHKKVNLQRFLRYGPILMDRKTRQVLCAGEPVKLTQLEYLLLEFFLTHEGQISSREEIFRRVWGVNYFGNSKTVDVHLGHLRRKLASEGQAFIKTYGGLGYGVEELKHFARVAFVQL